MKIFNLLLTVHIVGGGLSLLLGTYILVGKKGNNIHKLIGSIYFYVMLATALVALPMSYLHTNYFLFIIGVFTSYMLLTGRRYLINKTTKDVKFIDWALTLIMLFFGIAFVIFGFFSIIKANYFGIVFLAFGSISILFVRQDFNNFKGKSKVKNYWLTTHLQRMIGSYIASVTAFLVVNNKILPSVLAWLLPTLLITPFIVRWTRKYKVELGRAKKSNLKQ